MKKTLARIALFLKKRNFLYRLIPMRIAGFFVFGLAIPDIKFNLTTGKAIEITFKEF